MFSVYSNRPGSSTQAVRVIWRNLLAWRSFSCCITVPWHLQSPVLSVGVSRRFHSDSWGFGLECCECPQSSVTVLTGAAALEQCVHCYLCGCVCLSGDFNMHKPYCICVRGLSCVCETGAWRGPVAGQSWQRTEENGSFGFIVNGQIFSIGSLPYFHPPSLFMWYSLNSSHTVWHTKRGLYFYF